MRIKATIAAGLVATLAAFGAQAQAPKAYVIGVSAAMTGPAAATYAAVIDAMKAYVDHVNGKGGINGHPVQLVVLDDSAEPSRPRRTRSGCCRRTRWSSS